MNETEIWQMKLLKDSLLRYGDVARVFGVTKDEVTKAFGTKELRKLVSRAEGKCERCEQEKSRLSVHHVSYSDNEVAIVCCGCHRKIHSRAEYKPHKQWMEYMTDLAIVDCGTVVGNPTERILDSKWMPRPRRG